MSDHDYLPRIFVGTMYTHEGDFQECLQKIRDQQGVVVAHFIVAGLKEKEAHNALWHAWRHQGPSHDLFVKVDADTVLASKTTLKTIAALFRADPRVTGLQAPLHDYMTDSLINGLNAFSTKVVFNDTKDELYCDRAVDTNHEIVLRGDDLPKALRPAGFHCHHSNEKQAFHYGVHRMLKGQRQIINQVQAAWNIHHDRIRGMALIGARLAGQFELNRKFNYADPEFQAAFEEAQKLYNNEFFTESIL